MNAESPFPPGNDNTYYSGEMVIFDFGVSTEPAGSTEVMEIRLMHVYIRWYERGKFEFAEIVQGGVNACNSAVGWGGSSAF